MATKNFINNSYYNVWYTVQNDTCLFSYVNIQIYVLYLDINRDMFSLILFWIVLPVEPRETFAMHRLSVSSWTWPESLQSKPSTLFFSRISIGYCSGIFKATSLGCVFFLRPHSGTDEWATMWFFPAPKKKNHHRVLFLRCNYSQCYR